jgi:hypothetical protein
MLEWLPFQAGQVDIGPLGLSHLGPSSFELAKVVVLTDSKREEQRDDRGGRMDDTNGSRQIWMPTISILNRPIGNYAMQIIDTPSVPFFYVVTDSHAKIKKTLN